jgi:hypothetical protein
LRRCGEHPGGFQQPYPARRVELPLLITGPDQLPKPRSSLRGFFVMCRAKARRLSVEQKPQAGCFHRQDGFPRNFPATTTLCRQHMRRRNPGP